MTLSRRTTAATALALSLSLLVTACGSDDNDDEATASETVTSTRASGDKDADHGDHKNDRDKDKDKDKNKEKEAGNGDHGGQKPAPAPVDPGSSNTDGTPPNPFGGPAERGQAEPVDGAPADQGDSDAIRALVMGSNDQPTQRDALLYLPRHACSALTEENGGAEEFEANLKGLPGMDDSPQSNPSWRPVTDVTDIRVDGDRASARVAVKDEDPAVQRYAREGGQWKFCN